MSSPFFPSPAGRGLRGGGSTFTIGQYTPTQPSPSRGRALGPSPGDDKITLAPLCKEVPQQAGRFLLAHPRIDLRPVQRLLLLEYARTMLDRAALGVGRGVIEPRDPRMGDRPGAHRAGFERDP